MPLVTIWRDPKEVAYPKAAEIRDFLNKVVSEVLEVELHEVELRVRDVGSLDKNFAPIGIEIDTGPGVENWRVEARRRIALEIQERISESDILPKEWLAPEKSYVWLRIYGSIAFVPIGFPDLVR